MKVSLIIPTFNEAKRIGKCLESITNQTEKPDEIIVVDNNCTDETVEIAQKFNATIIKEKKQGMIHARNAGFNTAKYEILARIDADVVLPSNWISKIKEKLLDPNIGALSGPTYYYNMPKMLQISHLPSLLLFNAIGILLKNGCLFGPNMVLRKTVWEKVKQNVCLEDKLVHEDIDLSIHLGKIAKIKFDNKLIVRTTRVHWKQISTVYAMKFMKMLYSHRHLL